MMSAMLGGMSMGLMGLMSFMAPMLLMLFGPLFSTMGQMFGFMMPQ